ncbi:MAG: hypothetical protein ACLQVK_01955 [Acidimicrobiales bacterium]|jgi:hypothetical protein
MDPDDLLIERLAEEMHRSTAAMRLHPELRAELKNRMLATPASRWRRWLGGLPAASWGRGAVVGAAFAAVALAVAIPLALSHPGTSHSAVSLELVPKANSGAFPGAEAAPATCAASSAKLSVTPTHATLAPGQQAKFSVSEIGADCDLTVTVGGPSKAGMTVESISPSPTPGGLAVTQADFELVWSGKRAAANSGTAASSPGTPGKSPLPAGHYVITVTVAHSSAAASVGITVS